MEEMRIDKNYRITLPSEAFRNFQPDDFVKIFLQKDNLVSSFYLRTPKTPPSRKYLQIRRRLPDNVIGELALKQSDFVNFVRVEKLENQKTNLIKDNYIDLLALDLSGIMIDRFTKNNEEWVRFWQSNRVGGITNSIELKRFVQIDRSLGEFFGLMQAESGKRGQRLDFTNTFMSEHKIFVDVAEQYLGIQRNSWSFGLICNPVLSLQEIERIGAEFAKEINLKSKYYHTRSKTILKVAYTICINRKLLNLVMNNVLIKIRTEVAENGKNNLDFMEFSKGFIIKCLLGDGHISVGRNLTSADIVLSEPDIQTQNDFMKMLRCFGIHSNVGGIKVDISTDFDSMIWFLENGLFLGHKENRDRFLKYIKNNFYVGTRFRRFSTIDGCCNIEEFAKNNSLSCTSAQMYLYRNMKKSFLENISKLKNRPIYKVTNKGEKFLNLIREINL